MKKYPVKILYSHNSEKIGGGNKVLLGLFDKINRNLYEPWSLLPSKGPMERELKKLDVPCIIHDLIGCGISGSKFDSIKSLVEFFFKIRKLKFSLLHAQGPLSYRLASMLPCTGNMKRICHLHFPTNENRSLSWAFKRKPDLMISCSQHVADTYQLKLFEANIDVPVVVSHNFVDENIFCPGIPSVKLRNELSIDKSVSVVTIIGLVSERKGHPHFIEMAQRLLKSGKEICFLIAGEDILSDGLYRKKMEGLVSQLKISKNVHFLGFRSDILEIIRCSDVVVLPSHAEGMPMTILEVGACAKPVISYRIPGVDEVLFDGINGILVEENNVSDLADAVDKILSSSVLKKNLGVGARKIIEKSFTLTSFTNKIEQIYSELLVE